MEGGYYTESAAASCSVSSLTSWSGATSATLKNTLVEKEREGGRESEGGREGGREREGGEREGEGKRERECVITHT